MGLSGLPSTSSSLPSSLDVRERAATDGAIAAHARDRFRVRDTPLEVLRSFRSNVRQHPDALTNIDSFTGKHTSYINSHTIAPQESRDYSAAVCVLGAGRRTKNGMIAATISMIATGINAPEYEPVTSFTFAAMNGPTIPPTPHAVKIIP